MAARTRWYSARGSAPPTASERPSPGRQQALAEEAALGPGPRWPSALLLASCAPHASQDTLEPAGPYAQEIKNLFVPVFWVAVVVFVIVEGGIVLIAIRYRHRKGRERMPAQTHGNTRLEIGWTILPAIVLAFVTVPTVATIWDLARKPPSGRAPHHGRGTSVVVGLPVHRRRHGRRPTATGTDHASPT